MSERPRLLIRRARSDEADALTRIAFTAKRHWGYTDSTIELWRDTLTISSERIARSPTFVAEDDHGAVLGFAMLWLDGATFELDHLWVLPFSMGHGIGRALLMRTAQEVRALGGRVLEIDADPNAEGFYLACGARRVGSVAGPIPEDPHRLRPLLELSI